MASVRDSFIRLCLKPSVECDLPGRLRLRFGRFEMLPSAALPYLHYIEDILGMLAGVREVRVNARIGTILILYDAQMTSSAAILHWVDAVVEEGLRMAREKDWSKAVDEAELVHLARRRLTMLLPRAGKENQEAGSAAAPAKKACNMLKRESNQNWMKARVCHSLPGRLRLTATGLRFLPDNGRALAEALARFWRHAPRAGQHSCRKRAP